MSRFSCTAFRFSRAISCFSRAVLRFFPAMLKLFHDLVYFRADFALCPLDIDHRRVDAAVAEQAGQLREVVGELVKCPREQLTDIVRIHLALVDACLLAQGFQLFPEVAPVDWFAAARTEDRALCNPMLPDIGEKLVPQLVRDQDLPAFLFAGDPDGLGGTDE